MRFPFRKCYYVIKLSIFLVLIVTILTLFEQWRGGKRSARAQNLELIQDELEKQILEDESRIIPGLGEGGVAAHLVGEAKRLGEESEKELAVNVYLSDRIAYNRTLKDFRNPACSRVTYDAELPSASVIIIFHNEPYSVVIRTLWSVVNSVRRDQPWFKQANFVDRSTGRTMNLGYPGQDSSSPFVYLKEIILVDDNSTLPELKGKLSHYIRTRLPPDLIRILRLPDRVGLTQARLAGSRKATADILIFLDSHCEANDDWIRPLLQRIKNSRTAVTTPIIDMIESDTLQYQTGNDDFEVGGFTFTGSFTWIEVPEREKKRRGTDISPTWSPTMAGGLFAINRAYYWELGAYDEQMSGWGGENLEMSFRIWQCGGTLETIPCSRVGHVFRNFHPYAMPLQSDTHGINTARMAEVWMDDYAELFYIHRPDLRKNPSIGDVTHRKILREKLQCKDFQWYLDHVYKEKFVPVRDVYGFGRFMNPASDLCLDTLQRESDGSPLGVYPCHDTLQATQYLSLSLTGQLRDEEKCAKVQFTRRTQEEDAIDGGRKVLMVVCRDTYRGQKWRYLSSKQLQHVESGLCLEAGPVAGADALASRCRTDLPAQRWHIDFSEDNGFRHSNDGEPSEQELKLERLRGQRRKSRSLLSYEANEVKEEVKDVTEATETRRAHRSKKHGKKSKRRSKKQSKNKFILTLVRSLSNGTEEHLEADIHCVHKRLYPNNTFVRDLVTYLNDNDVKVINNGRIFERNKVSEVGKDHKAGKVLKKLDVVEPITPRSVSPAPLQPQSQAPLLQPWRGKKVKPGRLGSEERPVEALAMNVDPHGGQRNKIIVEEFVEVKPYDTHTKAPQEKKMRRKRRRKRTTPLPLYPIDDVAESPMVDSSHRSQHWDDYVEKYDASSTEDKGAMMISIESHQPTRSAGIYPAAALLQRLQHARPNFRANPMSDSSRQVTGSDDERPARAQDKPPVKLVMKSNLTFNLGEEFFNWRRNGDDIAHLLGELGIPVNISRSIENWRKTQRSGETTVTQHHNTTKSATKESESSESSESGSKE